jgi:nucleotide-binding universal stress UspA family protein
VRSAGWHRAPDGPPQGNLIELLLLPVESLDASAGAIDLVKDQLSWHGIRADTRSAVCPSRHVSDESLHIVAELNADLLVAGAFDHRPIFEALFGCATHALLQRADCPLMH